LLDLVEALRSRVRETIFPDPEERMTRSRSFRPVGLAFCFTLLAALQVRAADWPNWRGAHFDGISRETGLLKSWPAQGPKVLWRRPLTGGYSTPAVAGGRLYIQTEDKKEEIVLCLDAATGNQVWEFRYPCDYDPHTTLDQRFKGGPRSSPAVDGGHVYTIGTTGLLHCLDARTGKQVWRTDLLELAGRTCPEFGYTHSPLVSGDLVFVHPGGQKGNSVAALNKKTGAVVWKALDDKVGYSTPILIEADGGAQLVYFTAQGLVAVTPKEGRLLWRFPWQTDFDLNVATPIYSDGQVFISSNYGRGAALVRLKPGGEPEQVYKSLAMQNHFTTSVLFEGNLYGFSNDRLRCVEFATGRMKWDQRGLGRGSLLIADRQLVILGEQGELVLADASPEAYSERARWKALSGHCWNVPVLANGTLYARNEEMLVAIDLVKP
jgi:outer membrane protein assembly factor BamB